MQMSMANQRDTPPVDSSAANDAAIDQHIKQLAEKIAAGLVVPIVGSDLLKIKVDLDALRKKAEQEPHYLPLVEQLDKKKDEDNYVNLMDYVAKKIALDAGVPIDHDVQIDDVYHQLPPYSDIHLLVKLKLLATITEDNIKSDCYEKLAKIKTFKIHFNASCTDLLSYYVRTYQENCSEYSFYNIDDPLPQDVEIEDIDDLDIRNIKDPILYNLFGHFDSQSLEYILTEDDYIEFIFRLKKFNNKLNNLKSLLEYDRLTILFIGCNFPNWLFRFFIRAFINKPLINLKNRRIMVTDSLVEQDTARTVFFNRHQITQIEGLDPESLVNKLYDYLKANAPESINEDFTRNTVFISYASEDVEVVRSLNKQMSNYGVDTWFDIQIIERGERFRDEIKEGIDRACVFVPIISHHSVGGHDTRHYRHEWSYAIARNSASVEELRIVPVVIDDTANGASGIPTDFWDRSLERIDSSLALSEEFLRRVKEIQTNKRRNILVPD